MPNEQFAERLDDDQMRARAEELLPKVETWCQRAGAPVIPSPGSVLAGDDADAGKGMTGSHQAFISLAIGSEHLQTMLAYSLNFYPTLFSMQTLLRTAMVGGGQAIWLLADEDRAVRVERAGQLSRDAYWNQASWAKTITADDAAVIDPVQLSAVRATLDEITAGKTGAEVWQTRVIRTAAEYAFSQPPDPDVWNEVVASFRYLSSAAHALSWNLHIRGEAEAAEYEGRSGTRHSPSWTALQGAFSHAYALLDVGWRLLDKRSAPPVPDASA